VLLNVSDATLLVAEPFSSIVPAQLFDQLSGTTGNVAGKVYGIDTLQNDVVGLHGVSASERWSTLIVIKIF
jgi:hypothetical protein